MKKFSTLLAICGLFLVTGCQEEESVESSVGSSTPVVIIEDNPSDCCAQPDEKPRDPEEEPVEPTVTEEPSLQLAEGEASPGDEI